MNDTPEAVKHAFTQSLSTGLGWGLVGSVLLYAMPQLRTTDSAFLTAAYYFIVIALAVVIFRSIKRHGQQWQAVKAQNSAAFWGQLVAVGVFSSLLGAILFQLLLYAIPYFTGIEDWAAFSAAVSEAFSQMKHFVLAIIGMISALVSVNLQSSDT